MKLFENFKEYAEIAFMVILVLAAFFGFIWIITQPFIWIIEAIKN